MSSIKRKKQFELENDFLGLLTRHPIGTKALKLIEEIECYLRRIEVGRRKSQKFFLKELHGKIVKLNRQSLQIKDLEMRNQLKKIFRSRIKKYIDTSPFCRHGYTKPKGYPGDFRIVEAMYNNCSLAEKGTLGFLFDQFFLQAEYVQAVRDRKQMMKQMLKRFIKSAGLKELKILNIACGSSRELAELLDEGFFKDKKIDFVLLDQDWECLEYSRNRLLKCPANVRFHFVQNNVYSFFRSKINDVNLKEFDLIYSIGLADYLPDIVLGDMLYEGFSRLKKKDGKFIVAYKNIKEFGSVRSDWICDWNFVPRDRKDVQKLINDYVPRSHKNIFRYFKSRLIFFSILRKADDQC